MERERLRPEKRPHGNALSGVPRHKATTSAVRRVLRRKKYKEQTDLLGVRASAPKSPSEEEAIARIGLASPSRELPYRTKIENVLGMPLGWVKAHMGSEASRASKALGAEAYAIGQEVVFENEKPSVETVAHEAVHVVQQGLSGPQASDKQLEQEAEIASRRVLSGQSLSIKSRNDTKPKKKEKLPKGEEAFKKMWAAHPHNYQDDPSENTPSEALLEEVGLPLTWNTCAIRLSRMLNKIGLRITPAKVKAAGISRPPYYSKKTKEYLILSAKEMWIYLEKNFRKADKVFPAPQKKYKDYDDFRQAFESDIKPVVMVRKGIVAFEKIFGYSGTGHVDLFDGLKLSDAPDWYPSMRIHLWYVVVPDEARL